MPKTLSGVAITSLIGCSTQAPKNFDFPERGPFGYDTLKNKVEGLAGHTQHLVERCKELEIHTKNADFEGKVCAEAHKEEWLAISPSSVEVSE